MNAKPSRKRSPTTKKSYSTNLRLSYEAKTASEAMYRLYGFDSMTSMLESALCSWEVTLDDATNCLDESLRREDWNALSGALASVSMSSFLSLDAPGELVSQHVAAADRLHDLARRWYGGPDAEDRVAELIETTRLMSYPEAWAVICAVQFFRKHAGQINPHRDSWWAIPFRRKVVATDK